MATPDFNVGNDWSIDLFDPVGGGILSFSLLTGFSKQQDTTDVSSNALDGLTRRVSLPSGWSGSITYDRANRAIDDYFAAKEDAYYNKRTQPPATITETINEVGGGISQWRFIGVDFKYTQAGNAQGKDKVEVSIDFTASRRIRVI